MCRICLLRRRVTFEIISQCILGNGFFLIQRYFAYIRYNVINQSYIMRKGLTNYSYSYLLGNVRNVMSRTGGSIMISLSLTLSSLSHSLSLFLSHSFASFQFIPVKDPGTREFSLSCRATCCCSIGTSSRAGYNRTCKENTLHTVLASK